MVKALNQCQSLTDNKSEHEISFRRMINVSCYEDLIEGD